MRFNQKRLMAVPSSNHDIERYLYGLHSIIKISDIISFSSFGEGEMPLEVKLAVCRHLGVENPIYLGSSECESEIAQEVA